jgi:hypothetical protein
VGIMEEKIKIDGIDCILHQQLMEGWDVKKVG